jgi:membrane protease YdiL (CAAX protease family)
MGGGMPGKPLIEAMMVLIAFFVSSSLAAGGPGLAPSQSGYHLSVLALNLPRSLLILYLMSARDGLPFFGILRPRGADAGSGILCALGALAIALAASLAFSSLGIVNPLYAISRSGARPSAALIPLFLASSMATGYCEELFRSYLMRRLGQAGLSPLWTAIASSLLFAGGHGSQGLVGLASGLLLGLYFAWRWLAAANIHEIAIGHALYDASVFAIMLYS